MQSPRGKNMKKMDNTTPSTKFLKTISNPKLSWVAASRISQLRLQHAPLNSYLHRFKRVDKPNCLACSKVDKNMSHYLLYCPSYAFKRWALKRPIWKKQKAMLLETLLEDPDLAIPLANYIEGTNRFAYNIGEHPQT
jgi:hypothetical protein